jgi:predicted Zn-ribbon and HTH transcriptional regulator
MIEVLGAGRPFAEFVLSEPARCPNCAQTILENTLVRCEGEIGNAMAPVREYAPCWDETDVVLVDEEHLREAEAAVTGCEHCVEGGEMTFDYVLDAVTQRDPSVTEYVMCRPARCSKCRHEVTEKTFVVV